MNTAPVVNQMTLYGRFVVHCFFKIWLERSFQGAVNIEIVLESHLRVHWRSVHHLRVHGGGVHGAGGRWEFSGRGPSTTYSSSRMGLNEDETVKMVWSSSKMGVFEDGCGRQLGFGPAGRISIRDSVASRRHPCPCGGLIREHRTDAKWLKPHCRLPHKGCDQASLTHPLHDKRHGLRPWRPFLS